MDRERHAPAEEHVFQNNESDNGMIKSYLFPGLLLVILGASMAFAIPGGYSPAVIADKGVVAAAKFAVTAQEKAMQDKDDCASITLKLVKILSAKQQVVAGINYRLDLKVSLNGESKEAEVVVWWQAWRKPDPYRLTSWNWREKKE